MTTVIKKILFASDLSENARKVFGHAVALADRYQASIVILHVMEALAPGTADRVAGALGQETYKEMKSRQKEGARHILIDKKADALRVEQQLGALHRLPESGVETLGRVAIDNIIVTEGTIADQIVAAAVENACDLIVMGCPRRGLVAETVAGSLVRKVLRRTPVPVFLVPL